MAQKHGPRDDGRPFWLKAEQSCQSKSPCRWTADGASIFSVADGKKLAQTPPKLPTQWEINRQRKIAKAAVDSRVVSGMRLMPEYTPARAMLWGTIIALWGTGALVASTARGLDIHTVGLLRLTQDSCFDLISSCIDPEIDC